MRKHIGALGLCLLVAGLCVGASRRRADRLLPQRHFRQQPAAHPVLAIERVRDGTEPTEVGRRSPGRASTLFRRLPVESTVFRTPPNALRSSGNRRPAAAGMRRSSSSIFRIDTRNVRRHALFLVVFTGAHCGRGSAWRGAVGCAWRPAGGDFPRQLHRRGTVGVLHGRHSRWPLGAGTHSTREAAFGVRVCVPPGAIAKHHLPPATRGWHEACADRR